MQGEPEQIRGVAKGGVANQKAKVEKKKQGEQKKMARVQKSGAQYIRVLLYSYYTTITGWRVLLNYFQVPLRKCQMPESCLFPTRPAVEQKRPRVRGCGILGFGFRVLGFRV